MIWTGCSTKKLLTETENSTLLDQEDKGGAHKVWKPTCKTQDNTYMIYIRKPKYFPVEFFTLKLDFSFNSNLYNDWDDPND